MERMVEIGLTGLTHILKGGVRIEKNRMLCFVNTISWESIVTEKYHQNIHIEVRKTHENCVVPSPSTAIGVPLKFLNDTKLILNESY